MSVRKVSLASIILGLLIAARTSNGTCGQCSRTSYGLCLNDTAFKICFDGTTPSDIIGVCPEGEVCTTEPGICKPEASATPDCSICSTCASNPFTCISKTQFELCKGGSGTGNIGKCPHGHYCSILNFILNRNICLKSCNGQPTCYKEEILSNDYTESCYGKDDPGYYENISDLTCQTYVYCEMLNGVMNSVLYNCASGYFSAAQKKCIATKPANCV